MTKPYTVLLSLAFLFSVASAFIFKEKSHIVNLSDDHSPVHYREAGSYNYGAGIGTGIATLLAGLVYIEVVSKSKKRAKASGGNFQP